MNIEKILISKALRKEEYLKAFINAGIMAKHFKNKSLRDVFHYIVSTRKEQGQMPTFKEVEILYKFVPEITKDYRTDFIIGRFKSYYKRATLTERMAEISPMLKDDPDAAIKKLTSGMTELHTHFSIAQDVDLSKGVGTMLKECADVLASGGVSGIPTPWDELNQSVGGMNDEDFILITGRPKAGKSWIALCMAAYAVEKGYTVLVVSKEMSVSIFRRRYLGLRARVPYKELKSGKLTSVSKLALFKLKNRMDKETAKLILVQDTTSDATGMTFIDSKVEEYKPDLVLIDGMYLLSDDNGAVEERPRLRNISRDGKRMASRRKIPVVAVLQMNREKVSKKTGEAGLGGVYGTDGFAQDCDWGLEVVYTRELKDESARIIQTIAAREGEEVRIKIPFNLEKYNFRDVMEGVAEDVDENEGGLLR